MTGAPSVVFRTDAGIQIGSGHVARCRALAHTLVGRGARVEFICRELPGHLIEQIEGDGYPVTRLAASSSLHLDAQETRAVLDRLRPDWLIVDHYDMDHRWESAQRVAVKSIMVIDDLANREHDCDLLLDQNFMGSGTGKRYEGRVPGHCRSLLGPRYALLDRHYRALREVLIRGKTDVRRVLVFFGGTDATDETSKALRALSFPRFAHLAVDVVLGVNHPSPRAVEELAAGRPGTQLYRNLFSLAGLMFRADIAIGAGGVTTWERICLGLSAAVVTLAANQEESAAHLADAGLIAWAGRAPSQAEQIAAAVDKLLGKTHADKSIVDGHGASRVAAAVQPPASSDLRLRRVCACDAELLYEWRNDAEARAMSFDEAPIPWRDHSQWFATQLAKPEVRMFVGVAAELPVGQVRLDRREREITLSYAVDPDVRGRGFGTALVKQAVERARCMNATTLRARVKTGNAASRAIFNGLGWRETVGETECAYSLHLEPQSPSQRDAK